MRVGAVQQIAIEDHHVAGIHLHIDNLEALQRCLKLPLFDPVVDLGAVKSSELVRTFQHPQGAVLPCSRVQRDIDDRELRSEKTFSIRPR